jgi:hypothetical protein
VSSTPMDPDLGDVDDVGDLHIDHTVAHGSRVYDYLVGGTNNFAADREAARHMAEVLTGGLAGIQSNCRTNRIFLGQAVRYLSQQGIRQFLDIGPGIPTVHQTHEVAQAVAPEARVVYVDNDPIVLAHAHRLLETSSAQGRTAFLEDDLRNPERVLSRAGEVLDLDQPVGLILVAIYHMIPGEAPYTVNATLLDGLAPGSYLVASHLTADLMGEVWDESVRRLSEATREPFLNRTRAEFSRLFEGLELVPPGVAPIDDWLRDGPAPPPADVEPALPDDVDPDWVNPLWAAVGRKP